MCFLILKRIVSCDTFNDLWLFITPTESAALAAYAYGVNSCCIYRAKEEFETDEGKEILSSLGITGNYEGIGYCILGYAETEPSSASPRKKLYLFCRIKFIFLLQAYTSDSIIKEMNSNSKKCRINSVNSAQSVEKAIY